MTREDRGDGDPGRVGPERADDLPATRPEDAPVTDPDDRDRTEGSGDRAVDPATGGSGHGETAGPGERYCYRCGTVVDRAAEVCPECGVRQRAPPGGDARPEGRAELTTRRQRELEHKANEDLPSTLLLSLFVPPLAYVEVGKPGYAALNLLTVNYLLLGVAVVPWHTYSTITDAREQLRAEGVERY